MTLKVRVALVDHRTGLGPVVRITVASGDVPVADLVAALGPFLPAAGELYLGAAPLRRFEFVDEIGLLDGMMISVGGPASETAGVPERPSSGDVLLVVGGPDAGRSVPLHPGVQDVGRDPRASVVLGDPEVSRAHVRLHVDGSGVVVEDLGARNRTLVDGEVLDGPRRLERGAAVRVGRSTLTLAAAEPADRALVRTPDGSLAFNRRFRTAPLRPPAKIDFPEPHEPEPPPALSLVYALIPALGGVLMFAVLQRPMYLIFAVVGPLTALGGMYATRRQYARREARRRAKVDAERVAAAQQLADGCRLEVQARRDAAPDLATLALAASGPTGRLWERRPDDPDDLALRVGLADQVSTISLRGRSAPPTPVLPDLPVTVSLREAGSIGIAGRDEDVVGLAGALVFQVVTLHSPSEVRLVVVSQDPGWAWTRWLPHLRASATGDQQMIGVDPPSIRARLDEVEKLIDQRAGVRDGRSPLPRIVLLLDHPSRLDRRQIRRILAEGPAVGVHAISLESVESELPEEFAGATITWPDDRAAVRVRARVPIADVRTEALGPGVAEAMARRLAPLRPEETAAVAVPGTVRLLDLLPVDVADPTSVVRAWAAGSGSCRGIVGIGSSGSVAVELDDRLPHGLVAGTSGAGKSEFLKTYLAALALSEHPDDLQILIIDFKGGLDYRTLRRLPHVVDLVTNIDEGVGAVARALGLLEAEVDRRQRLVTEHGARDLGTYRAVRRTDPSLPVLGRLLVVADEFAQFAKAHPDLLDKLVGVARVGRAMGVHLLLATQRPAGAITAQIQANVPLRLCFRVLDGEADDVIGSREPEQIPATSRGRGYLRAGDGLPVEIQAARVAVPRPSAAAAGPALEVEVETWTALAHAVATTERTEEAPDELTDLWDVVEVSLAAARSTGWERSAVPWPRPLPESRPFVPPLAAAPRDAQGRPLAAIGLQDDPAAQRHLPFALAVGGSHVGVVGGPASGKTTLLRTTVAAMSYAAPPELVHLHAIDLEGGLRSLVALPAVGTVTDDLGLAARLVERLEAEIEARRDRFAAAGWSNLSEQWAAEPDEPLPAVVLVIDGWEQLVAATASTRGTSLADRVAAVLARGGGVGVQGIVAGDRTVLGHHLARLVGTRLVLPLHELSDYQALDVAARSVPKPHRAGRALLLARGAEPAEIQIDHLGRDGSGPVQAEALRVLGDHLGSRPSGGAWRFATLPRSIARRDLGPPPAPGWVPVGVGGDEAEPVWVDLGACPPGIGIAGPPGSGRSTALVTMARSLLDAGVPVVLGTVRPSPLADLGSHAGVRALLDWPSVGVDEIAGHLDSGPVVVIVDDTDRLDRRDAALAAVIEASSRGARLLAAGKTDDWREVAIGWLPGLRRSGRGLLLTPRAGLDGNAIGLPRALAPEFVFSRPVGRALWCTDGSIEIVQIPTP